MRVAVTDGVGTPRALNPALNRVAARCGDLRLLLGWTPRPQPGLKAELFADARTLMSGWGLRATVDEGVVTRRWPGWCARCPGRCPRRPQDVDVVVTERGAVDLRGQGRAERSAALRALWGEAGVRAQR